MLRHHSRSTAIEVLLGIADGLLYLLPNGLLYWSANPCKPLLRAAIHWSGIHAVETIRISAFHNDVLRFCLSYMSWEMNRTSVLRQGRTDVHRQLVGKQSGGRLSFLRLRTSGHVHVLQSCAHVR